MQLKSLFSVAMLALSVTACSSVQKIVYRIDVPQGNYLEATKVAQVQPGMNLQQVQYLLGTPVLVDPYNNNSWYYVFLQQKSYESPEQHTFVVDFDQRGIVTNVNLDKPLPVIEKQDANNTIIEANAAEAKGKPWWKFWN